LRENSKKIPGKFQKKSGKISRKSGIKIPRKFRKKSGKYEKNFYKKNYDKIPQIIPEFFFIFDLGQLKLKSIFINIDLIYFILAQIGF
jgi:hypothetical protein